MSASASGVFAGVGIAAGRVATRQRWRTPTVVVGDATTLERELFLLVDLGLLAFSVAMLAGGLWLTRKAMKVWDGLDRAWLPMLAPRLGITITQRGLPSFAAAVTAMGAAFVLFIAGDMAGTEIVAIPMLVSAGISVAAMILLVVVELVNRPRVVVPPGWRNKPGAIQRWWRRRQHHRDNRPETDHAVTVLDVRPATDEPDAHDPYFVAMCDEPDCDWMSDTVKVSSGADAHAQVRAQARHHASHVNAGVGRPVG